MNSSISSIVSDAVGGPEAGAKTAEGFGPRISFNDCFKQEKEDRLLTAESFIWQHLNYI